MRIDMRADIRKIISLFTPVLLHQLITLATALLFSVCAEQYGLEYSATFAVLVGNLFVIPIAAWMYRKDGQSVKASVTAAPRKAGSVQTDGQQCMEASGTAASPGKRREQILFGVFCFAAGGVLNIAWSGVLNLLRIQEYFSNQTQERLLSAELPVQIIGLGIVVPLAEELIFRGLTYRRMRQLFSVRAAVLLSAVLFAVYHGNLIQMIFAFPLALVLALVYEHGKLFIFPVLFHAGSNLTAILMQILL